MSYKLLQTVHTHTHLAWHCIASLPVGALTKIWEIRPRWVVTYHYVVAVVPITVDTCWNSGTVSVQYVTSWIMWMTTCIYEKWVLKCMIRSFVFHTNSIWDISVWLNGFDMSHCMWKEILRSYPEYCNSGDSFRMYISPIFQNIHMGCCYYGNAIFDLIYIYIQIVLK